MYAGADVPSHRHARHQKIDLGVSFADLSMVREKHSLPRLIECAIKSPWMHQIISEIDCIRGLQIRKLTKRKNNKTIGVKWCRASTLCATGSTPEATPTRFFFSSRARHKFWFAMWCYCWFFTESLDFPSSCSATLLNLLLRQQISPQLVWKQCRSRWINHELIQRSGLVAECYFVNRKCGEFARRIHHIWVDWHENEMSRISSYFALSLRFTHLAFAVSVYQS